MRVMAGKFKDVIVAVLPITVIVLILNFTVTPLETSVLLRFLLGSALIVFGLTFFLIGVDIGITPLGSQTGASLAKSNKLWILITAGLILGFFTSIAEPGLMVLANQVGSVTSGKISGVSILFVVSVGLAILLAFGFVRIIRNVQLHIVLAILYAIIFILALFTSSEFLAISFDASGATTGILAVPFILALSLGISSLKKDSESSEKDSFGLVSIASTGAIISVMILSFFHRENEFTSSVQSALLDSDSVLGSFLRMLPDTVKDGFFTLLPLLVILLILQRISFKLGKRPFRKILKGFLYGFVGIILFFIGVNAGFMEVGIQIGQRLAALDNKAFVIGIGFVLGAVTILAEPAVYVLTHQIEDVTSGYVKRKAVLAALSIGVGVAVALSVVRILIPELKLWHYLLPGYILAVGMSFFVPKLFVGIAFDAGGVATGPMTATFILAFTQGAADKIEQASVLVDGFGMISMVALLPIITLQLLGFIFMIKSRKGGTEKHGS